MRVKIEVKEIKLKCIHKKYITRFITPITDKHHWKIYKKTYICFLEKGAEYGQKIIFGNKDAVTEFYIFAFTLICDFVCKRFCKSSNQI